MQSTNEAVTGADPNIPIGKFNFILWINNKFIAILCSVYSNNDIDDEMWIDDSNDRVHFGKLPTACIFCSRVTRFRIGVRRRTVKATSEAKKNKIFDMLRLLNQEDKVADIGNMEFVYYHLSCLAEAEHKLFIANKVMKETTIRQKIHLLALTKVQEKVITTLIDKNEVRAASDFYQYYASFFEEEKPDGNSEPYKPIFQPSIMLQKILQSFPLLTKTCFKSHNYLHQNDLSVEEIYTKHFQQQEDLITRIKKISFEIRKTVKEMDKRELPKNNLTVKDIVEGECDIPRELFVLIESLVKGPRAHNSDRKNMKISSICNSIIFTMSNGTIKPSSCLTLGLTTKSLTGSRKMLNILNRMGFCISYTLTEEIETELAHGCSAQSHILPYGLSHSPILCTHVAFDNFDRYVETSSGKDTLHDTVGIVYQNSCIDANLEVNNINLIPFNIIYFQ